MYVSAIDRGKASQILAGKPNLVLSGAPKGMGKYFGGAFKELLLVKACLFLAPKNAHSSFLLNGTSIKVQN